MLYFRVICTFLIVTIFSVHTAFAGFADVASDHPHAQAIEYLQARGIGQENFYPRRPITLAEFLVMGFLAADENPTANVQNAPTRFSDVPADSWFAPFVARADRFDILADYQGRLHAERRITRGEAAKLGLALFGIGVPVHILEEEFGFRDVRPQHRYAPYAYQAAKLGVIDPIDDTTFGVTQSLNRGEAAELLYRLANYKPQNGATFIIHDNQSNVPHIALLETVWNEVQNNFLFEENIDEEIMLHAAIKGAVDALGDPYSTFLPPDKSSAFTDGLAGEIEGIGAYLSEEESGDILIVAPIKDSPAEKAGLRAGDIITAVDGVETRGRDLADIIADIKGPRGTTVKLTIKRNGSTLTSTVTRDRIEITSVDLVYTNNFAVISVSQFGSTTSAEFAAVAEDVLQKSPRGIILDLRNNPGGLLTTAVDLLGYFLPNGSVAATAKYRDGTRADTAYRTEREPVLAKYPMTVLINKGSASASEIMAGALQDHGAATIMGEQSFGKGTVQELSFFTDGTALKLTIAHWFSPREQPIDKHGITPSVEVLDNPDTEYDEALEYALQHTR